MSNAMDALIAALGLPEIVHSGPFGRCCGFSSFEPVRKHSEGDHYTTNVLYGTLNVIFEDRPRRFDLVLKLKHSDAGLRHTLNTDSQFHNEILFYERIVHLLLACVPPADVDGRVPTLARFFYGRNVGGNRSESDVIVLENAVLRGYAMSEQPLFLDLDHVLVALKSIAKFHGLSYRTKRLIPVMFKEIMADIKKTQWRANGDWVVGEGLKDLMEVALKRLEERRCGDGNDERMRRFRSEMMVNPMKTLQQTEVAGEPTAVLCHGDFNRNNMLFRYEEFEDATGTGRRRRPVDVLLYDMATVKYGSPALDLASFLYMNTDRQLREDKWDVLLDAYCAALAECVSDVPGLEVLGRTQLEREMREHAFYGLASASFFLRIMTEEHERIDFNEMAGMNDRELTSKLLSFGGDRATDLVADVLQHFLLMVYPAESSPSP